MKEDNISDSEFIEMVESQKDAIDNAIKGIVNGEKIFTQKAYEKLEMAKRNSEAIQVMLAIDEDNISKKNPNGYSLVLMVGAIPIAEILTSTRFNKLKPEFDKSIRLREVFDEASQIDNRETIRDFDFPNEEVTAIIKSGLTDIGL